MKYNYLNPPDKEHENWKSEKKKKNFLAYSERSSNEHLFGLVLPSNI